jgi:predicted nucleotidyltransferase
MGLAPFIVGAFARDLHLQFANHIVTARKTEDFDLAMAVPDWRAFEAVKTALIASGEFTASDGQAHRLRYRGRLSVDLVPFGGLETQARSIAWPPDGRFIMDVFGFEEASRHVVEVVLPGDVRTNVVSLAALGLLKLTCWHDRHARAPLKDATDLMLIARHYLEAGNQERLFQTFPHWFNEAGVDYESAGAQLLGYDIAAMLDPGGIARVAGILSAQSSEDEPGKLPVEMEREDPEHGRRMLLAMERGVRLKVQPPGG